MVIATKIKPGKNLTSEIFTSEKFSIYGTVFVNVSLSKAALYVCVCVSGKGSLSILHKNEWKQCVFSSHSAAKDHVMHTSPTPARKWGLAFIQINDTGFYPVRYTILNDEPHIPCTR